MKTALTLSVKGINEKISRRKIFNYFVNLNWGFISNLDTSKHGIVYLNLMNWEDKLDINEEGLQLKFLKDDISVKREKWHPSRKWDDEKFRVLTHFLDAPIR